MTLTKQQIDALSVAEIERRLEGASDSDAAKLLTVLERIGRRAQSAEAKDLVDEIAKRRAKRRKATS